jgi:adenylyl-sulfate kinase
MSKSVSTNVVWHRPEVSAEERQQVLGARGSVVWFTGLSGSGKSTIAHRVEQLLLEQGVYTTVLDGDNLRHGLNGDLGFTAADRAENIRRVGEVAKLFAGAGVTTLSAFISPYRADRARVRSLVDDDAFVEVFVDTPLEICEQRDPKGLYRRARAGEIRDFTGIDAPYEAPTSPEVHLRTAGREVNDCAAEVVAALAARGLPRFTGPGAPEVG